MKVFWIVNFIPNEICHLFKSKKEFSGGWIEGVRDIIVENKDVELVYIFKTRLSEIKKGRLEDKKYSFIGIPNHAFTSSLLDIFKDEKPNVIHIWGTEFSTGLEAIEAAKNASVDKNVIVSIQGLVSKIYQKMTVGLPNNIANGCTIYEKLRKCSIKHQIKSLQKRSFNEIEMLNKAAFIIGRTNWDREFVNEMGLISKYISINENLRDGFYNHRWEYKNCEKNTIFISRGDSPIKGFHLLLKALPAIKQEIGNVKVYVAGPPPFYVGNNPIYFFKKTTYSKYIKQLIKKNNLKNNIVFLGTLKEQQMIERYLKTNIFVMPSTIENSPNSLCEAMLLGMPCVASNVGGVESLLEHESEGFVYSCESVSSLSHYLLELLNNNELSISFGANAHKRATITHDRRKNSSNLLELYYNIYHEN